MTNQSTLERAIKLAIERGWYLSTPWTVSSEGMITETIDIDEEDELHRCEHLQFNEWAYSKEFCKALWGENTFIDPKPIELNIMTHVAPNTPLWQYHLQMMVTAEDPIKYLADNI